VPKPDESSQPAIPPAASGPVARLFNIPAGVPFLDSLAAGIIARVGDDPLALSRVTVLLPTTRAVRNLREAFLRLSDGRPILLPRLTPLGDVDADGIAMTLDGLAGDSDVLDLAPAIAPLRRQLLLTRLVQRVPGLAATAAQAASLAGELARLLDEVQTERLDFAGLRSLVPEDYAGHWQKTLQFLTILTESWPAILSAEGGVDPAVARDRRLTALARSLQLAPPDGMIIAAGSTGSIPATAALLGVIATLPQGFVLLPGLDQGMDETAWLAIDDSHPQAGLKRLLDRLQISRDQVSLWPGVEQPGAVTAGRLALLSEALRPAETTEAWRDLPPLPESVLDGLQRFDLPTLQEEAGVIALLLRGALEVPGRTAALVTPDRTLARRVTTELRRWDIVIDDSAGRPLSDSAVGSFMLLTINHACQPDPVRLLSLLKHPLTGLGRAPGEVRRLTRQLERRVLRGLRPAPGFSGLQQRLASAGLTAGDEARLQRLLQDLERCSGELCAAIGGSRPLTDWVRLHGQTLERLADTDEERGALRVWRHDDGEAAARFLAELADAAAGFPDLSGADYAALLPVLLQGCVVRPRYGLHPRLHILGPLEARLQHFDLTILGGLNEGSWPPAAATDPWLSRPMRQQFGLPSPERHLGQTAHDFIQAAGGRTVVLTRAERVAGTPSVPARWLLRLETVLNKSGLAGRLQQHQRSWIAWLHHLDQPDSVRPCAPPAPAPPLALRPRRLSVTEIETWMRDPYAIYARHILKLRALDPVDADPGAAERGQFIHAALDAFVRAWPTTLPPDPGAVLRQYGRDAFGPLLDQPEIAAFWWTRFERIADWFVEHEAERRRTSKPLATEVSGSLVLDAVGGPFTLTAKADRIDRLPDGSLGIHDYKTGTVPGAEDVRIGRSPQLPLEAAIARAGGFSNIAAAEVTEMTFWKLSGGNPPGVLMPVKGNPAELAELAETARRGLAALVARFDDPATPYRSQPRPDWAPRFSDYEHLARLAEWSTASEETDR
jgi:ATP-dependent helicase/nuclease subunit B